jgi:hypothetical protein
MIPRHKQFKIILALCGLYAGSLSAADVVINEFLAKNDSESPPGNAGEDWIELYNNESVTVNLSGWCLRDSKDEWCFPDSDTASIPPFGYQVVIASGDGDDSQDPSYFHTNFKLSKEGEFIRAVRTE